MNKDTTDILINPLFVIGLILFFNSSCTKEEKSQKIDPIIKWENPPDIIYGSLLSTVELNATANVPGIFVYAPPIGTKLNVGENQDLKVEFTPINEASYNSLSKTVKINVLQQLQIVGFDSIIFNPSISYGTMTDQEGNVYKTVIIGTQTWMTENLRTTKYNDGKAIPNVKDSATWINLSIGAFCNNNNRTNIDTIKICGSLYNWYAVNTGKLAPIGWHVPTDNEWTTLTDYLDGKEVAGCKLKEIGSVHWLRDNFDANNSSGFTAIPGGYRLTDGIFDDIGYVGLWWSSSEIDSITAYGRILGSFLCDMGSCNTNKVDGFSIRCVKD